MHSEQQPIHGNSGNHPGSHLGADHPAIVHICHAAQVVWHAALRWGVVRRPP